MGVGKKQKALDHKQHLKAQKAKEQKKKERRNPDLPANYNKHK